MPVARRDECCYPGCRADAAPDMGNLGPHPVDGRRHDLLRAEQRGYLGQQLRVGDHGKHPRRPEPAAAQTLEMAHDRLFVLRGVRARNRGKTMIEIEVRRRSVSLPPPARAPLAPMARPSPRAAARGRPDRRRPGRRYALFVKKPNLSGRPSRAGSPRPPINGPGQRQCRHRGKKNGMHVSSATYGLQRLISNRYRASSGVDIQAESSTVETGMNSPSANLVPAPAAVRCVACSCCCSD